MMHGQTQIMNIADGHSKENSVILMLIMHMTLSFYDIFLLILLILQPEILFMRIYKGTESIFQKFSNYSRQIKAKGDIMRDLFDSQFVQNSVFFYKQITSNGRGEVSAVKDGKRCNLCRTLMMKMIW
jgi:hypothetical protein